MTARWLPALLLVVLLAGCPKAVPEYIDRGPVDAGVDPRVATVDAIEAEVAAVLRAQDEALWRHWTTGAPLDLTRAREGHDALYSRETLRTLRAARAGAPDGVSRRAAHLEHWLAGELLSRALETENDAVASLEAGLTFTVDGREVAWRELPQVLLTEKSAVKRRALWRSSLEAAERLDAALARRDAKAAEAVAALDSPSTLELAAETRELDLDELARAAEQVLASTEDAWRAALERQAAVDVRLPLARLTRAELPRLLRMPPEVDAAFPKEQLASRAVALLGALGVYGRPGLTLDLAGGAKKHPLPLTIAPAPADVRVSFRPAGGLRDQAALLGELGAALALSEARTGHLATERLGDPAFAQVLAELFAGLVATPAWLESVGIKGPVQQAVLDAWTANRLFLVRRAAGVVLVRLETQGLSDAEARARFVQLMSRALGLPPSEADGVRWRIDTDDFLRSATQLKAAALARALRAELSDDWFQSPEAFQAVATRFAEGTSTPLEARFGKLPEASAALSRALGGAALRPGPWPAAGQVKRDADGGLRPGPWPAPARLLLDGGVSPASAPATAGDGGLEPGPWPAPARLAFDAGASSSRAPSTASDGGLEPGPWPAPARLALDAGASSSRAPS
ncbi:MAG: hypothetical protein AB1730_19090, partial [Myxococcota bacterium]